MTSTLHDAFKRMSVIREGLGVRNLDGSAKIDDPAGKAGGFVAAPDCRSSRSTV